MKFECVAYYSNPRNTRLGYATFRFENGLCVPGFSLHQKEGKRWISFPFQKYIDKNGEEKFKKLCFFEDRGVFEEFCNNAKKCVDDFNMKQQRVENVGKNEQMQPADELPF